MSNEYTININQGSDFRINLVLKDSEGVKIDLTGYTFRGQIRKTTHSSTILAAFSFDIKDQVTDTGSVDVILTNEQTEVLKTSGSVGKERNLTCFFYDIEQLSGSLVTRILEGIAQISPEVTK